MSQNHLRNHLKSEFAQIPNALIEDRTLSATARALFCYLAVKPDDWEFKMKDIADAMLISIPTLRKVIAELSVSGWIDDGGQDRGENGEFGAKIFSIYPRKIPKNRDVQQSKVKKSPQRQRSATVANRSGKNIAPINNKEKKYSKRKNTSSSSLIQRDDEDVIDPYANLPDEVDGLSRSIIIVEIEAMARKNGGDYQKYLRSLVKEILSGKGRTMTNIRNRLSKKTRERGEQMQAVLQEHGYPNFLAYLEDSGNGRTNESV
jgi:hypothetical protein